jgi:hypothetical protein
MYDEIREQPREYNINEKEKQINGCMPGDIFLSNSWMTHEEEVLYFVNENKGKRSLVYGELADIL